MNNIRFTHELIKGKIAELIFAQMHPKSPATEETMEIIKRAPDFTIINHKSKEVHLIEVKYMSRITKGKVASTARKIQQSWKRAALFIASPDGFYFDTVEDVITNKGEIKAFKHPKIPAQTQAKYLDLLNTFIT